MNGRIKQSIIIGFSVFCILIVGVVTALTVKSGLDSQKLLKESIMNRLVAISRAASEIIDVDDFKSYNSNEDIQGDIAREKYENTLIELRELAMDVDATYIYALKKDSSDVAIFVFDTDSVNEGVFIEYELSEVHIKAFAGKNAAGIMNVKDEYGTFSTGAVPIFDNQNTKKVVGIVCTDIADEMLNRSIAQFRSNTVILVTTIVLTLAFFGAALFYLLRRVERFQKKLDRMANYDKLTDLPNRWCLLEYLSMVTSSKDKKPFALFFIDLDNFKRVNDSAGHDAGDALLQRIGAFLKTATGNATVFRPGSGNVNITARVGGDEFILVVSDIDSKEKAAEFAQKLLQSFSKSEIDRYIERYGVTLSIGISLYPYHSESFHVLIKYADIAMYDAKTNGKNTFSIYTDALASNN